MTTNSAMYSRLAFLSPVHSINLKNHHRRSYNIIYGHSVRCKRLFSHTQNHPIQRKDNMVGGPYLPPWFRLRCRINSGSSHSMKIATIFGIPLGTNFYVVDMFFSVAPMMDWTDNHYRTLARLISKHAWLYTEMVVAETIVHQKENLVRELVCFLSAMLYRDLNLFTFVAILDLIV